MRHAVLLVGCYGITTLVVNDADNIISLKCFTPVWYCIVLLCTQGLQQWGTLYPTPAGFEAEPRPPKGFPLFSALRMASTDTTILLILWTMMQPLGTRPRAPLPLAYDPAGMGIKLRFATVQLS